MHAANYWSSYVGCKPYPDEENIANGYCGAWVDFFWPHLPAASGVKFVKVSFSTNRWIGGGHNAIRIEFPDGRCAYLDNGWIGGSDHIFFSEDIQANGLTNETPAPPH